MSEVFRIKRKYIPCLQDMLVMRKTRFLKFLKLVLLFATEASKSGLPGLSYSFPGQTKHLCNSMENISKNYAAILFECSATSCVDCHSIPKFPERR